MFDFTIDQSVGADIPKSLSLIQGESSTETGLIMVPTGSTTVTEDEYESNLFKPISSECEIKTVSMETGLINGDSDNDTLEGTTATLEPWEALVCTFTNDNTAFVKIMKKTIFPVEENTPFDFEVIPSVGDSSETTLTVITGSSTTMSGLIMVPTGSTTVSEIEANLQDSWRLEGVECGVGTAIDNGDGTATYNMDAELGTEDNENVRLQPWDVLVCEFTNNQPKEGLTPGFWRANAQNWGASAWPENPNELFKSNDSGIFGPNNSGAPDFDAHYTIQLNPNFDYFNPGTANAPTLFGAIAAEGGDVNALARHCVAAKLNAEHPDIDYPVDAADVYDEIIKPCTDALNSGDVALMNALKDQFATWNEYGADIPGGQHNDLGNNWTP